MKRVLSIILAIAMCISLLPTFASAADNSVDFKFIGNGIKLSSASRAGNRASNSTSVGHVPVIESDTVHRIITFKNNTSKEIAYTPGVADSSDTILMAGTWEVEVPASGTYVPQINYIGCKYSPKWEIFLTKKPEAVDEQLSSDRPTYDWQIDALDSADYVGTYDGYSTSDGALLSKKFIDKSLTAGTYYLTIIANGENAGKELYSEDDNASYLIPLLIESFTLTPATALARDHDFVIKSTSLTSTALTDYDVSKYFSNDSLEYVSWVPKNGKSVAALNPLATDGYELPPRAKVGGNADNSPNLYADGFVSQFIVGKWDSTQSEQTMYQKNYEGTSFDARPSYAIRINVETSGIYSVTLKNDFTLKSDGVKSSNFLEDGALTRAAVPNVYIVKATDKASENTLATTRADVAKMIAANGIVKELGLFDCGTLSDKTFEENVTLEKGEYFVILDVCEKSLNANSNCYWRVYNAGLETDSVYQLFLLSGITLTPVVTAEDEALAAEQAKYDTVKTAKEGAIASATAVGLNDSAYINIIGADVADNSSVEGATDRVETTRGAEKEITAKEVDGYEFLYWAKGLGADRRVVSTDPTYTVKATSGGTWLYAYYKKTTSNDVSVMFYNADGSVIRQELVAENDDITFPDDPSFNSYTFKGWALGNVDNIITEATASGKQMLFVAQYNDPSDTEKVYKVTVNGYDDYHAYGESVTAVAAERDGTDVFVYWKKGEEIVSFDKEYTFNVFENCTLTAVYAAYKPVTDALRKIIISGNGENIMAEFIGLGSAVETGILFHETAEAITLANASHKIAMTTNGNHLAALNDVGNCIGYAILSNGNVIYDK
ncbi:MAG: hypothetical protein IJE70_01705 [Oscillospiraceae bacterium]|nr:hypothetical protein [Oscillospiraceae bacterium]